MIQVIDHKAIEDKWLKAWDEAKLFEAEPSDRASILVTAAWPYTYIPQHIGHMRTYGTADFYARYMRMKGLNVLFPMGFHRTGTPILAIVKRILSNDLELRKEYELYHMDWDTVKSLADPAALTEYFSNVYRDEMKRAGLSIDWRRSFNSTDAIYSKMVEWQFSKLNAKGFLVKGRHAVGWCPNEGNAVGQHDTLHDVAPEIEEMTVIKFRDSASDAFFACATYRPETIYGVTNLFVNDKASYVIANVGGSKLYVSKEAATALAYQIDITVEGEISAAELLTKKAVNPITGESIDVLAGYFVKPDFATGIVMSVPAHAPFDYVALERLGAPNKPQAKVIIGMQGAVPDGIPAAKYLKDAGAASAAEAHDAQIEEATKHLYKDEQRNGVMLVSEYTGKPVSEARGLLIKAMRESGKAISMYIMANEAPVYCRCGYRAVVKVVADQWFIDYGNPGWKEQVREYLPKMKLYPEKMRAAYNATVEWLELKPVERAQGLGTRFPLNPAHIIEPLSDSTIYMAFYTFVHTLRAAGVEPEQLKPEFFDYVLLGKSDADAVAKSTGIDPEVAKKCRDSFEYWYKYTSRHSAHELIPSHLTFYIFNHLAIFPERFWPKQIVTSGMINLRGQEMHKSTGNVMPLSDALSKFGADTVRFILIVGGDLESDMNFMPDNATGVMAKNQFLYDTVSALDGKESGALGHIDYWLYSKLNSKIKNASAAMDRLSLREAYIAVYFDSINELKWYAARGGSNALVLRDFLEKTVLMLAPAMPFLAEELWHMLGKSSFIAKERWPEADESMINLAVERAEDMVQRTVDDAESTLALTAKIDANKGKKPKSITVIVADDWKATAYNLLCESRDIGKVMQSNELKGMDKQKLSAFLAQFSKRLAALAEIKGYDGTAVFEGLSQATPYMSARLSVEVKVEREGSSSSGRAQRALPDRPSLDIRWE
ncbi:MAG: leucine--tRNA ligase [Candidatus Marsarchaeota archaeon]|nr:leucine--tRNA ligase [Candidatus Marsarchaeota archaeon]